MLKAKIDSVRKDIIDIKLITLKFYKLIILKF